MNIPKNISREDFLQAVKEGVKEAILTMTESGDGYNGLIIREPFLQAIKEGVEAAFPYFNSDDFKETIQGCFPYPSEIHGAIYSGTKAALKDKEICYD